MLPVTSKSSLKPTELRASQNIELENLRLRALGSDGSSENLDNAIDDLLQLSRRIHAGFLFHSPKTLQPLLRAIGETNVGAIETGWQMFGDKLGLDVSILKVINNNQFNHEDPMYNTLLHYVQYEDATIEKVVRAIVDMGRLDVIMRTKEALTSLANVILNHERELLETSRGGTTCITDGDEAVLSACSDVLIKPVLIPDAPFIIKNVQAAPLLSTLLLQKVTSSRTNVICAPSFSRALAIEASPELPRISSEVLVQATPLPTSVSECSPPTADVRMHKGIPYSRKVMLTFAADGAEVAAEVARVLRQDRGSQRIGVLILKEQLPHLQADPNLFICASVQLVDYVIPILTEGYLRKILRKTQSEPEDADCVDARYVSFVYQTMSQDYCRRECLNTKVRCLIPDDQISKVLDHLVMANPLFSAWEKVSRLPEIAERILASKT